MSKLTFEQNDKLDRKEYAESLTKSIENFYQFSDDAYVLSLNASFGSGKTMFVKMWRSYLQDSQPEPFQTIYFNAWKHDFCDDPTIPLLIELLQKIEKQAPEQVAPLKRALAVVTVGLSEASKHMTGIDPLELGEKIKELTEDEQLLKIGGQLYEAFKAQQQVMTQAQEALKNYVETLPGKPLFIFIDELDRARPDYAVRLLETLKHLFGIKGVCFVLSVDKRHLESSVKTMYGSGLDFDNYYKKFVTRQFDLPAVEETSTIKMIDYCFFEYFDEKQAGEISFPFSANAKEYAKAMMHYLSFAFSLTPRQIKEYFRTTAHFLAVSDDITGQRLPNDDDIALVCLIQAIEIRFRELNQKILRSDYDENDLRKIASLLPDEANLNVRHGCSELRHRALINLISGLCFEGNSNQMAAFLTQSTGSDTTEPDIRTHAKRRYNGYSLPKKQHTIYVHFLRKIMHWQSIVN